MRVTIVCDVLGAANNGTTIAALNLMNALEKRGHQVRVVCPDANKKGSKGYYVMPVLHLIAPLQKIIDHNGVSLALGDPILLDEAIRGADEVHIMMPLMLGRKALRIARSLGVPVSAGFHVQAENVTAHFLNFMDWKFANDCVYRNFYKHFFSMVDAIHYPTDFIRRTFEEAVGHKTPAYVISNGVNEIFRPHTVKRPPEFEGKFLVICTGRYSKEKKQPLLIKAVGLSRHKDDIKLVFAGTGPRLREMEKAARKWNVEPTYRLFGREALSDLLAMGDLYVHTSEVEIEAISCLEAIASGLVPLINDSPKSATREFALDPNSLFKLNDAEDLSRKLDYWIERPDLKKKASEKYSDFASRFAFEKCMDRMVEMIAETAEKRK